MDAGQAARRGLPQGDGQRLASTGNRQEQEEAPDPSETGGDQAPRLTEYLTVKATQV